MPERSRGKLLTMGRYTNPASFPSLALPGTIVVEFCLWRIWIDL